MRFLAVALSLASLTVAASTGYRNADSNKIKPRMGMGGTGPNGCLGPGEGVRMFIASGKGTTNRRGYGLLDATVESIRAAIPGSTNYSIPYKKDGDDNKAMVMQGQERLSRRIQTFVQRCPETPIVLIGYSSGGIITMNTLCGRDDGTPGLDQPLPAEYSSHIIATVVYGEESRAADQPWNRGTCTGPGFIARTNSECCAAFAPNIRSWCDATDPQCCLGDYQPDHYIYPEKYDGNATAFVKRKYQKYWAARPPTYVPQ